MRTLERAVIVWSLRSDSEVMKVVSPRWNAR
jgi:hypothetical protein